MSGRDLALARGWQPANVTAGGNPVLFQPVEIELFVQDDVVFGTGQENVGIVFVTSHRVLWIDRDSRATAWALPLDIVQKVHVHKGLLGLGMSRLEMYVRCSRVPLQLGMRRSHIHVLADHIGSALERAMWVRSPLPAPGSDVGHERTGRSQQGSGHAGAALSSAQGFSTSRAGVGGIIRKVQQDTATRDAALSDAFRDMDSLAEKAGELVQLAEKLAAASAAERRSRTSTDAALPSAPEVESGERAIADTLLNLGIANPVTKNAAGARFHAELARQLADFLLPVLDKVSGGTILLTDVYCLYNRARGTDLVSPDDLCTASEQFERLGLPLRLRNLGTDVKVIEDARENGGSDMTTRIRELASRKCGVSARDLAREASLPLLLAREKLLAAEHATHLCRDEAPSGLVFYHNIFLEASTAR